jgi:O-antigen ligase
MLAGWGAAIDPAFGTLRGTFVQKNVFAREIAMGVVAGVGLLVLGTSGRRALIVRAFLVVGVSCLLLAGSSTALVALVLTTAAIMWMRHESRMVPTLALSARLVGAGTAVAFCVAVRPMDFVVFVFSVIGRDYSFTGRTSIWEASSHAIEHRPLLGYGYSGFWRNAETAGAISRAVDFSVPHAHNGILDLLLGVGFVGIALVVIGIAPSVRGVFTLGSSQYCPEIRVLGTSLIVISFVVNVTESQMLSQLGAFTIPIWVIMMLKSVNVQDHIPNVRSEVESR